MQAETPIVRWEGGVAHETRDCVAVEAPLEIAINGQSVAVTMRTPGDDLALATGFLYAEGIIRSSAEIDAIKCYGGPGKPDWQNVVQVTLAGEASRARIEARLDRNFLSTSSCGVCGKASFEAARCTAAPIPDSSWRVPIAVFPQLNSRLRAAQQGFERTGGLHAAGLFDGDGELLALCEDIGRHNAVDKLIGREVQGGRLPLSERILMVSGRTSFEILQKAAMARLPIVCAVSAPSSLAVRMANDLNITLIGFLRGETMNVYSGNARIAP
jgi:FdhD protein